MIFGGRFCKIICTLRHYRKEKKKNINWHLWQTGCISTQWRIQDYPEEGALTPKGGAPTYYLANFSRKLHENEEILGQRGVRVPHAPLRSATATCTQIVNLISVDVYSTSFCILGWKAENNMISADLKSTKFVMLIIDALQKTIPLKSEFGWIRWKSKQLFSVPSYNSVCHQFFSMICGRQLLNTNWQRNLYHFKIIPFNPD